MPEQPAGVFSVLGIEDPATGTDSEREMAFILALRHLRARITACAFLPIASLDRASLTARLREIERADGATNPRPDVA